MTRVLVLSDLWMPFPGGAERLIYNLARDLDERDGIDVYGLTGYEAAHRDEGAPVHAQPIGDGDGDPGWGPVAAFIDGFQPDVILTHHHYARLFHQDLVATGLPIVQLVLNGQRLPEARLAVYISEHVRRQDPAARPSDLTLIPPAFPDVVAPTHGDAIGFVKPIPHKGVELVYRLAGAMPDRRFVVLRGEWQNLEVMPRRPLPNVEFMEPVEDIREFYARVRLVLMPSLSEDAGTVAQECTLNRIPCVSSYVDGLMETNGGGVILPPHDLRAWRKAIVDLDDPRWYGFVVDRMGTYYETHRHAAKLAHLAMTIRELG